MKYGHRLHIFIHARLISFHRIAHALYDFVEPFVSGQTLQENSYFILYFYHVGKQRCTSLIASGFALSSVNNLVLISGYKKYILQKKSQSL
jgi:hypothetical protein